MKIQLKLLETDTTIQKNILANFVPDIKKNIDRGIKIVKGELPRIIKKVVTSAPEYQQLIGGQLKFELGIPDASNKIAGLISLWSTTINYSYVPPRVSGNKITSSFSASLFKADFSDVLGTEYAKVVDSGRGYSLPWLEWLALKGNAPIIKDHQVVFGFNRRSRTGQAVMRQNIRKSWSVPAQYAGTISDNWITRSIDSASGEIDNLLDRAFKNVL